MHYWSESNWVIISLASPITLFWQLLHGAFLFHLLPLYMSRFQRAVTQLHYVKHSWQESRWASLYASRSIRVNGNLVFTWYSYLLRPHQTWGLMSVLKWQKQYGNFLFGIMQWLLYTAYSYCTSNLDRIKFWTASGEYVGEGWAGGREAVGVGWDWGSGWQRNIGRAGKSIACKEESQWDLPR